MTLPAFVSPPMDTVLVCRAWGSPDLETILAFGNTPLADVLIRPQKVSVPPIKAPRPSPTAMAAVWGKSLKRSLLRYCLARTIPIIRQSRPP